MPFPYFREVLVVGASHDKHKFQFNDGLKLHPVCVSSIPFTTLIKSWSPGMQVLSAVMWGGFCISISIETLFEGRVL